MPDIVGLALETLRTLLFFCLLMYVMRARRQRYVTVRGWRWVLWGFALLLFGSVIDLTDEFPALSRYGLIGRTVPQELLEEFGFSSGLVMLLGGLVLWLPSLKELADLVRQRSEALAHRSTHDVLTDLPNRSLLRDRLAHAVAHAERERRGVGVLYLDLDAFKAVNDSLGHGAGDRLLQLVAERWAAGLAPTDTLARLGDDEFVVVLERLSDPEAAGYAAQRLQAALAAPFHLQGQECFVTTSIGISVFPRDGGDAATLLRNADAALRSAKRQARGSVQWYTPAMGERASQRLTLGSGLRRALEREELVLHYQPQVTLDGGRIVGVEALVRWAHPERGLLPPGAFLPVAEETGLIPAIDRWVLWAACAQMRAWRAQGLSGGRVSVNLSAPQFLYTDLVAQVAGTLETTGLPADALVLEITEGAIVRDVAVAATAMQALKAMGVSLAIDDFGTGYSSLNYLKRFPVDELKVAQDFVRDLGSDANDAAIVRAILALGRTLGMRVVAEGVETPAQRDFLRDHRCHLVQGYLYSRPLPAAALAELWQTSGGVLGHDAAGTRATRNG